MQEAMLYEKLSDDRVRCGLCAHRCVIADGKKGICQVRGNRDGTLYTLVYGRTIAQHVDPVEKKPLLHFYPGSTAYSIATPGCNFRCRWCQNWHISQMPRDEGRVAGEKVSPESIVAAARRSGCRSISYTYTEPTIYFEYAYETAQLAHREGIANVFVTNGHMGGQMLRTFHPCLDAANVDLKAFREETYRRYIGGKLEVVLESLRTMKQLGVWVEVTTLLVPGVNDDPQELRDLAGFLVSALGPETPWHLSRFFPSYRVASIPPTPVETLERAAQIGGEAGLRYVYLGNVAVQSNTSCHQCGTLLVRRSQMAVLENRIGPGSRCPQCDTPVAGVGMGPDR